MSGLDGGSTAFARFVFDVPIFLCPGNTTYEARRLLGTGNSTSISEINMSQYIQLDTINPNDKNNDITATS